MASEASSRSGLYCDDTLADISFWTKQEVLRIEALSERQVFLELEGVMEGRDYSWHTINELLQLEVDQGRLECTQINGDVIFEWNNLCKEKREWEKKGRLSHNCARFNEDCLINLKILPFQAGLDVEGKSSNRI